MTSTLSGRKTARLCWLRALGAAFGAAVAASCFLWPWRGQAPASQPAVSEALRVAINRRDFGRPVYCAVTGSHFAIGAESRAAICHGRTYYFRGEEALKAFLAAPDEYLSDPPITLAPQEKE